MNKTTIDPGLVDKAPLTPYEKDLIKKIDIEGLPLKDVAEDLKKDDSTISLQHKKALEKYSVWSSKLDEQSRHDIANGKEAAIVFGMLKKGKELPDIVIDANIPPERLKVYYEQWLDLKRVKIGSWDKFIECLENHGAHNLENCSHNIDGYCMYWRWSEPPEKITDKCKGSDGKYYLHADKWYCGLCTAFEKRREW